MRRLLQIIFVILFSLGIFGLHVGVLNTLPYPLSSINIIFIFLIFYLAWTDSGRVVWLSFCVNFLLDIYSASPFGIYLFAGTMTMLIEYWFYRDLFTNKSLWALIAMTASGLIMFRIIYTICISWSRVILWADLSFFYMWEMIFTLGATICIYMLLRLVSNKLN